MQAHSSQQCGRVSGYCLPVRHAGLCCTARRSRVGGGDLPLQGSRLRVVASTGLLTARPTSSTEWHSGRPFLSLVGSWCNKAQKSPHDILRRGRQRCF